MKTGTVKQMRHDQGYYTRIEVAEMAGVHKDILYYLVRSGELPAPEETFYAERKYYNKKQTEKILAYFKKK